MARLASSPRSKGSHRSSPPRFEPLEQRRLLSADVFVTQHNIVSDGAVPADHIDADLKNPWGISFGPTSPFWISDNGASKTTLYTADGTKQGNGFAIPGAGGQDSAPTGQVFNGGVGFPLSQTVNGVTKTGNSLFIFAGEDGGISGWNPAVGGPSATLVIDQTSQGSVFKGLALNTTPDGNRYIYATDFHNGMVDVFNSSWQPQHWAGAFTDKHVHNGFAPFNIQSIGDKLYVTYAKQDDIAHDDVAGAGNGFVDVFSTTGMLLERFHHSNALNSPWGVTQVPNNPAWGELANHILVGQFGSGQIAIYDQGGGFDGLLHGSDGKPVFIDGLWALTFGGGGKNAQGVSTNGDPNTLYFTAGLNGEADGLFGSLSAVVKQDNDNHDHGNRGDDNGDDHGNDHHDGDHHDWNNVDDLLDNMM